MNSFKAFLKKNKKEKPVIKYVASNDFVDENGNPIEWELKAISSKQVDILRDTYSITKREKGKAKTDFDSKGFNSALIVETVIYPDLFDAELQESYGVSDAGDLIYEMLDNAGDYNALLLKVNQVNGFDESFDERVEAAKN